MIFAGCLLAAPDLCAQTQPANNQNLPAQNSQPPGAAKTPATPPNNNKNPFPEDESTVPVMPDKNSIDLPTAAGSAGALLPLPGADFDPVKSPDDATPSPTGGSSSSLAGIDALDPDTDTEQPAGKHGKRAGEVEPEHQETAAEDESVGSYYLGNKNWKAALSRYESALVLDPDNPDVYWGLAESERNLGRYAEARENYQKVMEYDPGSHHAKEAGKALKEPEIANAKALPPSQPAPPNQ